MNCHLRQKIQLIPLVGAVFIAEVFKFWVFGWSWNQREFTELHRMFGINYCGIIFGYSIAELDFFFWLLQKFSWLLQLTPEKAAPQKRHVPIQFDSNNDSATKQHRPNKGSDGMKLYTPPSGKFSNNFQSYGKIFHQHKREVNHNLLNHVNKTVKKC